MGGGLSLLVADGAAAPAALLQGIVSDGATAMMILLAMAFGLIGPKMIIERFAHAIEMR
jgi:hypothetical protein